MESSILTGTRVPKKKAMTFTLECWVVERLREEAKARDMRISHVVQQALELLFSELDREQQELLELDFEVEDPDTDLEFNAEFEEQGSGG